MIKKLTAAILLASLSLFSARIEASPPPEIRVLILENMQSIDIASQRPLKISCGDGRATVERRSVRIERNGNRIDLNGSPCGQRAVIVPSDGNCSVNGKPFHGTIDIFRESSGISAVSTLDIERYLSGVLGSEISSKWPMDAIKAQAVAARTYSISLIHKSNVSTNERNYDIKATMFDQVYDGARRADDRTTEAVRATSGEVLERGGRPFTAYYHSCCGGVTELAKNVWPGERGGASVQDRYCARSPNATWNFRVGVSSFLQILKKSGKSLEGVLSINTTSSEGSPRADDLLIEDDAGLSTIKATELRRMFGYGKIKSTWFDVSKEGAEIIFSGRGYGHGVGMCQWGAKGMADEGIGYKEILKFYYPDADIMRIY